jgi:hypothetical protein
MLKCRCNTTRECGTLWEEKSNHRASGGSSSGEHDRRKGMKKKKEREKKWEFEKYIVTMIEIGRVQKKTKK